jgi:hypothetical protein
MSMFRPEGCWCQIKRKIHNTAHPGASVAKALNDISAAGRAKVTRHPDVVGRLAPSLLLPQSEALVAFTAEPSRSELAVARACCLPVGAASRQLVKLRPAQMMRLHEVYCDRLGLDVGREPALHDYRARWLAFVAGLAAAQPLPEGTLLGPGGGVEFDSVDVSIMYARHLWGALSAPLSGPATSCRTYKRGVRIGPNMVLRPGSFFLARPSMLTVAERIALWFGRVLRVMLHTGPDGVPRVMLEVRPRVHACVRVCARVRVLRHFPLCLCVRVRVLACADRGAFGGAVRDVPHVGPRARVPEG